MRNNENQKGQTVVTLLFLMVISISIISAVVVVVYNTVVAGGNFEQGTIAYYAAEAGAENGLIRLLRNPAYLGETIAIDNATVTIEVVGGDTITSTAEYGDAIRKIEVQTVYNNNTREILLWREIN